MESENKKKIEQIWEQNRKRPDCTELNVSRNVDVNDVVKEEFEERKC